MSSETITPSEQALYLRRLRFPPNLEARFRSWHYANVRSNLRIAVVPIIAFALFSAVRDYLFLRSPGYAFGGNGTVIVLCLLLFGLTFRPGFERVWQPVTVILVWLTMTIMLNSPNVTGVHAVPSNIAPPIHRALPSQGVAGRFVEGDPVMAAALPFRTSRAAPNNSMLMVQLYTLMIFLAAFRLGLVWTLLLDSGVLFSAYLVLSVHPNLRMFSERSVVIMFALMITAVVQERLSRTAFLANYLLDQERNEERRRRERTEGMLHVLGQAIGGIVHDLGNPLSAVWGGAQLLEMMLEKETDAAKLKELAGVIEEGARLLNYQRLSLMEQTRILEGKPIPVEHKPVSLRRVIETGIRYQKPRFAYGRQIVIDGDDLLLCADEMKLITVFMNLIGNALKYSEGEIRVHWRTEDHRTWIAVLDQGLAGQGISEAQARRLFVAFGRLEAHAEIEGTGLGLLSVRKIMEAHGGEVYIEGHWDGSPTSPVFSTAQAAYPSMLCDGFLTAFVLVCPIATS